MPLLRGGMYPFGLFRFGSANGTYALAGTALYAKIGVDHIFAVTLADSADRALLSASAAGYAIIGNFVSHGLIPPVLVSFIVAYFPRN